jgi:hypothetical protein
MIRVMVAEGSNPTDIRKLLESEARARGDVIPRNIGKILEGYEDDTRQKKPLIHDVLPGDLPCEIYGGVIKIQSVNFCHRFHIPNNSIYQSLLKDLVREPFSEIVVRGKTKKGDQFIEQFTFYIPSREIMDPLLRTGMHVYARLIAQVIQLDEEHAIWIATDIDWD